MQESARKLIYTDQGEKWLAQFEPLDQEAAKLLANCLTLVSHNEFRRNLELKILEVAKRFSGPVGLYAVRELKKEGGGEHWGGSVIPFFQQVDVSEDRKSVNAVGATADQGSEAIVAQIIRQLSKTPGSNILNHPSKEELRGQKCDALVFVDDFIGSGRRVSEFIEAFWQDSTVVSWLSSKHINIQVVAYTSTEQGARHLSSLKSRPELSIHRDTPTFWSLPISVKKREAVLQLAGKYGPKGRRHIWWGFDKGMVSLVFEHGCPNNTPGILWDSGGKKGNWTGLFPNRTVGTTTASIFPAEIVRGDLIEILLDAGQTRLANSGALMRRGEVGHLILVVLGLLAKGQKKRAAICYATGLSNAEYKQLVSRCIDWKFLTPELRITLRGLSELAAARRKSLSPQGILDVGSDYYYPQQLRVTTK